MKRRDTREVCEEIKNIISPHIGDRKVFNRDVAETLRINESALSKRISSGTPPYEEIIDWCARTGVDPMSIFYERG